MRPLTALLLLLCTACAATPPGPRTTVRKGARPAPLHLKVGTVLHVTSDPSPHQPWTPLTSSDEKILTCTSHPGPHGAITATCKALHPGHATIATVTSPHKGDPQGPPQSRWTQQIQVTP
ncbi:hypothetical protein [Actinomadura rupiterrae]|uniref:hypothetical protein n=1 Tax=Actinomadura rupiterrae TaxID=559627 RepID=UPI0020A410EE|nr:hypothetical protein [Actinomadura rupiterrae]MCP2342724.1 hypothetical protein [Actinomadura rupiterrae]